MKKIIVLSLIAVLVVCCVSCAASQPSSQPSSKPSATPATELETPPITTVPATTFPLYADELTDAKCKELIDAWKALYYVPELNPRNGNELAQGWGMYYLGTYNGYDIISQIGLLEPMAYRFGEEFFGWPDTSGTIYTHHNGVFKELGYAYADDGAISDVDLHTIAQKWYDQLCELYGEDRVREFYGEFAARYE